MKKTIEYTSKSANDVVTIAMKKKSFPWWILLLLLPLILLIPIKRDFLCQLLENNTIPVSQTMVTFNYNDVGVFGARTANTVSATTSDEGKCEVRNVSEPLWYYLFVDSDTLIITTQNNCPKLENHPEKYSDFHRGEYRKINVENQIVSETFTVVNKKTGEPLADSKVTVEIITNGNSQTQELVSDADGKVNIEGLSSCSKVKITASKEKFIPDTKEMPVSQIPTLSNNDKTLRLQPDVPLMGQSGDVRVNFQWYCKADLDLMVIDPCGNDICFNKKKQTCNGNVGELDVDANFKGTLTDTPQENIFWKKASPGTYVVMVVGWNHKGRKMDEFSYPIEFNLSVFIDGERTDIQGSVPREKLQLERINGSAEDFMVYQFEVGGGGEL